jgi:hypothetical protein
MRRTTLAKYRVFYIAGEVQHEDVEARDSADAKLQVAESLADEMRGIDRSEYTFELIDWDMVDEDFSD